MNVPKNGTTLSPGGSIKKTVDLCSERRVVSERDGVRSSERQGGCSQGRVICEKVVTEREGEGVRKRSEEKEVVITRRLGPPPLIPIEDTRLLLG